MGDKMVDVKKLTKKSREVFEKEGAVGFAKRVGKYVAFKVKTKVLSPVQWNVKDVLFVSGCALSHPERYRVDHQIEQLEACGLSVDKARYTELDSEMVKFYRAAVIFRCPITKEVRELIRKAHCFNKKVFFDVDDLVIDRKYTDEVEYVQQMDAEERKKYDDGVEKMGETMRLCDYCITTTETLAKELREYGKEVFVNKNVASEEMVRLSQQAMEMMQRNREEEAMDDGGGVKEEDGEDVVSKRDIVVGYLSGSITHNADFEMIKPALVRLMKEFPEMKLLIMGHLDLSEEFGEFQDRIERREFVKWQELPKVIAELDINLAPLERTVFNDAKSENKWTEAALCKTATVASDFGEFGRVIKDGETGMLCRNAEEWYRKIKKLIEEPELRKRIAENAYKKVMKEYVTTYTGLGLARFIESKLAKNILFVLPSMNISGGINVALKHCEILRRNGWDVTIFDQGAQGSNAAMEGERFNVIWGTKLKFLARFEEVVATMWVTVDFVRAYPQARIKSYLVQGFETEFYEFGDGSRKLANATYSVTEGIRFLTVSEWCKGWLEDEFGQKVRFAPNGINTKKYEERRRDFNGKVRILVEGDSESEYKNVDESFRIANRLDRSKYEVWYLSYRGRPKEWYHVDKFCNAVPFEEVGKVYQECDILLKTSLLESFSYPPLEMMATGGYAVVLPTGGNQEYLRDGENCLTYEQGNIEEAIEKIERIVVDEKLRRKLDAGAKKTVAERDWKGIEKKVLKLYE